MFYPDFLSNVGLALAVADFAKLVDELVALPLTVDDTDP